MANKLDVTDASFDKDVIQQSMKTPVLVDFWAPWCGPCQMMKPLLEKLADEFKGKFILAKVNVEENQKTAEAYDIMSIPDVKLFKDGSITNEFVGALPEAQLKEWISSNL